MSRNVIILHAHDMGRFTAPYLEQADTPHMASFAASGACFLNAHSCGPTCSPSRAALLTGEYPHQSGMLGLSHLGWSLKDPARHLGRYFSSCGVRTARIGVQHEYNDHELPIYEEELPVRTGNPLERDADAIEQAVTWIRAAEAKRPFFLWFGMFLPHLPWLSGAAGNPAGRIPVPANLPDCEEAKADLADFQASLRATDQVVGKFLDALAGTPFGEDTAVIVTTDHGIPLPGHKCNLTQHGTGVTLLARFPGLTTPGTRSRALVSHLDIFPTLCDWMGCPHPPWLEGKSLVPHLKGEQPTVHHHLFAELNHHIDHQPERSIRTDDWLYIRRVDVEGPFPFSNCDDTRIKKRMVVEGWGQSAREEELLFDLREDPDECHSIARSPGIAPKLEELRHQLLDWMLATDDPLLGYFDEPPRLAVGSPGSV